MNKTLIFDFGNVFIHLDIEGAQKKRLTLFRLTSFQKK